MCHAAYWHVATEITTGILILLYIYIDHAN